jgi:hypothetical protein
MTQLSAGLKSSSPLLKQGAPTNLSVERSLAPVLMQGLKPNFVSDLCSTTKVVP